MKVTLKGTLGISMAEILATWSTHILGKLIMRGVALTPGSHLSLLPGITAIPAGRGVHTSSTDLQPILEAKRPRMTTPVEGSLLECRALLESKASKLLPEEPIWVCRVLLLAFLLHSLTTALKSSMIWYSASGVELDLHQLTQNVLETQTSMQGDKAATTRVQLYIGNCNGLFPGDQYYTA